MQDGAGKVVVVTGGSRDVVASIARLAAARGYAVCVSDRDDHAGASRLVDEIRASGGTALAHPADVTRSGDVAALFAAVDTALGPVTHLVHAAWRPAGPAGLLQLDAERVERLFGVTVVSALLCAREAVRRLSTRQGGRGGTVVFVGAPPRRAESEAESVDEAAASKAVETIVVRLGRDLAPEGIRVNAVRAAPARTSVNLAGGMANRTDRTIPRMAMEAGPYASEAADKVLWLLSDSADRTSGAIVEVTAAAE